VYLADITERKVFGGGEDERETRVFGCELVGVVNGAIAGMAKSSFICRTENSGFHFVTDITVDLHVGRVRREEKRREEKKREEKKRRLN